MRAGAWVGAGSDKVWGAAAAAAAAAGLPELVAGSRSGGGEGGDAWAVEVGWLVEDGVDGKKRRRRREVLTAVFESGTMVPLAVWKGVEEFTPPPPPP